MKKTNIKFMAPLLLTFILQGCMPDSLTKFSKAETKKAAVTTTTTTTSPTAPPDLTTLDTFQLKNITQKSTSYQLHKYGPLNATAACEIKTNLLRSDTDDDDNIPLLDGSNDILCWMEAEEVQLFFNGADFQLNVPAGFCEYIQVKPFYFWNAPPMNTNKTVRNVVCAENNASCASVGGPMEADLTCAGDYTAAGGPNCDEGIINLSSYNVTADTPADPGPPIIAAKPGIVSLITSQVRCGGKRTNCYGGPGKDFAVSAQGFPIPTNYLAYNGQSVNYSVTAPGPIGKGYSGNHYISNFTQTFAKTDDFTYDYTAIGTATGLGQFSKTSSVYALSYSDIGDISYNTNIGVAASDPAVTSIAQDPFKQTSSAYKVEPFYEFSCLNFAHEVKGRIRLQIREWNKKFSTPVTNEIAKSAPINLLKQSTTITDYETSGINYWNDVPNWDTPYSYSTPNDNLVACAVVTPARDTAACYAPPKANATTATTNGVYGFLFPYLGL